MIYVLLTSQSLLPTEAVEAQRAIKGLAPATKTKPIHLRPQRDRMQATYSNPKPAHKNSRKKRLCTGATLSLLKCATSKLFWKGTPASLKAGYPPWPCVLLWTNCFLFHFVSISLQKLTLFYCSPGLNSCHVAHEGRDLSLVSCWCRRTVSSQQVTQEWSSRRIGRRMAPCSWLPFPLSSRLWPYNGLLPKNGPLE